MTDKTMGIWYPNLDIAPLKILWATDGSGYGDRKSAHGYLYTETSTYRHMHSYRLNYHGFYNPFKLSARFSSVEQLLLNAYLPKMPKIHSQLEWANNTPIYQDVGAQRGNYAIANQQDKPKFMENSE